MYSAQNGRGCTQFGTLNQNTAAKIAKQLAHIMNFLLDKHGGVESGGHGGVHGFGHHGGHEKAEGVGKSMTTLAHIAYTYCIHTVKMEHRE